MISLKDKNAYISGGTSGIGLAVGEKFASLGANVFAFSVDEPAMREQALAALNKARANDGQRFEAVELDVTDAEQVREKLAEAVKSFGAPYVLVNSAGIGGAVYFEELTDERFDRMMKINLYGTRSTVVALLPYMKPGGGYIVNVSSMSGLFGLVGYTAYASSKYAVVGFSQALRSEMKPHGIGVSVLCPPQVRTPLLEKTDKYKPPETKKVNDNAGLLEPEEVAEALWRGMKKNQAIIVPGRKGRMFYLLDRFWPSLRERMTDRVINSARKG